jgi:alpha-L-arabinofuranosidase
MTFFRTRTLATVIVLSLVQPQASPAQEIKGTVKVSVQADKPKAFLAPRALGVSWDMSAKEMDEPLMPQILASSGVTTLRYPGLRWADMYHWSTNTSSGRGDTANSPGDFGRFAHLLDRFGTAVVTVNYGSNLDSSAGGTPEEAAAWVAYAMGDPSNGRLIGKDGSGHDWQTVGFWASLRASHPLATDDGLNFLRIAHTNPILIKYWEVGNEVYRNGFYDGSGSENDLHAPYAKDPKDNEKQRKRNPALSPDTYGNAFLQFSKAMKAVDARIKIGVSLDVPLTTDWNTSADWVQDPISGKWFQKGTAEAAGLGSAQKGFDAGVDWDKNVLKVAGKEIDFVSVHWYSGDATEASHYKDLDNAKTLMKTQDEPRNILAALEDLFQKYCGQNRGSIQVLVTEMGIKPYVSVTDKMVPALFAADAYVTLVEYGIANVDWGSLRGAFLIDENKPGPIYFAPQLVRRLADLNDQIVTAVSSNPLLGVHASVHKDGSVGIMLINKDPKNSATVKVSVSGAKFAGTGTRYDFGRNNPAKDYAVPAVSASELGNEFTVSVPSYTVTVLVIPKS